MDYCSSCRRHLNGALVCPGCGAYAPDIDPRAVDGRPGPAPAPVTAPGGPAAWEYPAATGTWHDGTVWDGTPARSQENPGSNPSDEYDSPDTDTDTETAESFEARPQGRAARRRQMARWKKNQRRAVVATAVALVGGGLTVAAMNGNAKPDVQAATPQDTTMGGAAGQAPTYTEPTSSQAGTPRSGATPSTPSHADRASRHQQSRAADPRTTPVDTRTDAAATPRELPLTTAPRRKTATDTADTATGDAASTASKATEPTTAPATDSGSDPQQPASPSSPPPAATTPPETSPSDTKPKELCLLVICLG
ncbi:SCO2400 family protein [Streptomyces paradoxus]|uniref:SCO2400 family protein n=1 Tax=Streptomyces paradoxus TaxID=66375 RepID=UPI0037D798E7